MFIVGGKEFGVITQSTMAFATLLGAFSLIVTQFQSISAFTAVVARLHTLSDAMKKPSARRVHDRERGIPERVAYENVTMHSADRSRLLWQT